MKLDKTHLIVFVAGAILGLFTGFFICKGIYDRPIEESVTRDTVRSTDTIHHYYPQPTERQVVRYVTRLLPVARHDTVEHFREVTQMMHDTVAVEVPIESRHYSSPEYDAWISGYEPSLDSIKVYREKEYITETITRMKPPNKITVGIQAGYGYGFKAKQLEPYVGIGIGIRIF